MRSLFTPKKMVQFSLGGAGMVAILCILDLALGVFFGRAVLMDIMFILSAAILIYLAYGVHRENI